MHPSDGKQVRTEVDWPNIQAMLRWGLVRHRYSALVLGCFEDGVTLASWLSANVSLASAECAEVVANSTILHNLALSRSGLEKLGVECRAGFPHEFVEGMASERARNVLGDGLSQDAWEWGAGNAEDFALVVCALSEAELESEINRLRLSGEQVDGALRIIPTYLERHEHFGFRDGLSNPRIRGASNSRNNGTPEIAPGEFIFGYADERGGLPPPPLTDDPRFRDLPASIDHAGMTEFGRDGSFLVIRQIRQYPQRFDRFLRENAQPDLPEEMLAAKMMGRWRDGTPTTLSPERSDHTINDTNDFGYATSDKHGFQCPLGAHIRRANPRDGLTSDPEQSLRISNRHRILRRSRMYRKGRDEVGLQFMCFNVSFARQFEHIQESWINGTGVAKSGETDPIMGDRTGVNAFTLPATPMSRSLEGLDDFIEVTGGGYFFMPAIDVFAGLVRANQSGVDE
ncbi:MAG: Dyp-type peroxidase [Pseudomonadota bacterium]